MSIDVGVVERWFVRGMKATRRCSLEWDVVEGEGKEGGKAEEKGLAKVSLLHALDLLAMLSS